MFRKLVAVCAVLVVGSTWLTVAAAPAAGKPGGSITRKVEYDGRTLTLKLDPVSVRSPGYRVWVQQADGTKKRFKPGPSRAYLGRVVGSKASIVSGVLDGHGKLSGQVIFDGRETVFLSHGVVSGTRAVDQAPSYHWPSAADAARNVTVGPHQAGRTTYRWDLGYDLDHAWFSDETTIRGSAKRAARSVDLSTVNLMASYVQDAMLKPATRKVVIRASEAKDPYATSSGLLGTLHEQWLAALGAGRVDASALLDRDYGGGVAYVNTAGGTYANAVSGGAGDSIVVLRHELGHNWGASDNHTNGPEGATINSGNAYARFDGTELSAVFRHRDADPSLFTKLGRFPVQIPPYAALDLRSRLHTGDAVVIRPLRNDLDANGGPLRLVKIGKHSELGGTVVRHGNRATYTPPTVGGAGTTDWVRYVIADSAGLRASGIAMFSVSP